MGLIVLMGQIRKESVRDYWSTDPTISTPIFPQTMNRNRFEYIWQAWHFSDISLQTKDSGRLFKIFPVYEYFYRNLGQCTAQSKNSLDEAIIPWRGRLAFRTYKPGKKTKYGLLVKMVFEAVSGYICNMEIYAAEGKKLQDTVLSLTWATITTCIKIIFIIA
jgi:hypothetical protein